MRVTYEAIQESTAFAARSHTLHWDAADMSLYMDPEVDECGLIAIGTISVPLAADGRWSGLQGYLPARRLPYVELPQLDAQPARVYAPVAAVQAGVAVDVHALGMSSVSLSHDPAQDILLLGEPRIPNDGLLVEFAAECYVWIDGQGYVLSIAFRCEELSRAMQS